MPPLILPVVEELVNDTPAVELFEVKTPAPGSGVPPLPGFLPFLFAENDGGMDADNIYARFGEVTSLTLSPTSRESSDIPHTPDVPPVGALCPASQDSSAVGYARFPLPFLEERSTLGPGCAFRNTTYRVSDYAEPTGDYGDS